MTEICFTHVSALSAIIVISFCNTNFTPYLLFIELLRYRHKLLKWWCQSFLVGIDTIYCGFRDDDGVVTSVKEFRVRDLPKMAKVNLSGCFIKHLFYSKYRL